MMRDECLEPVLTIECNADDIDRRIDIINDELERYTNNADRVDYSVAVASGLLCGVIDSVYIGEFQINKGKAHETVNRFIESFAKESGWSGTGDFKSAVTSLENKFKVAQDSAYIKADGSHIRGISHSNHHLADLAHHPTPLGLMSAIMVHFLRVGTFVTKDGKYHLVPLKTSVSELSEIWIPVIITGIMNWMINIAENPAEDEKEAETPEAIRKLAKSLAAAPAALEVLKCSYNWFGHLVSDAAGSKHSAGKGMGIPGVFLSMLYEIASVPPLNSTGLLEFLDHLYYDKDIKFNLRTELAYVKELTRQSIPVIVNELLVRSFYFIRHLVDEVNTNQGLKGIRWNNVVPIGSRTVDRMMTISSLTFTYADTMDATVRAALESSGSTVLFFGRFVSRINYIGAGRAVISVAKEVSNENKEKELLHEKRLLMEAKSEQMLADLQRFKEQLEDLVYTYLAEDIGSFMEGFDLMNIGLLSGDSDLVVRGNVVIQRALNREPQFTTQEEFDYLMETGDDFIF